MTTTLHMRNRHLRLIVAGSLLFLTGSIYAQNGSKVFDWENPDVVGINKENPHATLYLPTEKRNNKQIVSLNGSWKFKWSPDPDSRPVDFYKSDYSVKSWTNIVVPGNMEMQGFGIPIYANSNYPFKRDPPRVMSEPP